MIRSTIKALFVTAMLAVISAGLNPVNAQNSWKVKLTCPDGEVLEKVLDLNECAPGKKVRITGICSDEQTASEIVSCPVPPPPPQADPQIVKRVETLEKKWDWGLGLTPVALITPDNGDNAFLLELGLELNLRIAENWYGRGTTAWAPAYMDGFKPGGTSVFLGTQYRGIDAWRFALGYRGLLIWDETADIEGDLLQTHMGELQVERLFNSGFRIGLQVGFGHSEWVAQRPQVGLFPAGTEPPMVPTQESGFGATRLGVSTGWTF
ncbi:hypothetical protein KKG22_02100 [Patescibacteria group bacterium]|nr:hypothetical protein [Patescibacteria group bacterium]MBU1721855.1 hypothetical protein [Patescibacteria group bacterium]MBU1901313.1 hypothetical protein [Patescibacteria group bacterium]